MSQLKTEISGNTFGGLFEYIHIYNKSAFRVL
jgi:hypothetical protein